MEQIYTYLQRNGMNPTWVGGEFVIANVPCMVESGNRRWMQSTPEAVYTMAQAVRLVEACN